METQKHIQEDKIDVTRNSRGYNWTMTFYQREGLSDADLLKKFVEWDKNLKEKFSKGVVVKDEEEE